MPAILSHYASGKVSVHLVGESDRIAVVTIRRPDARNACDVETVQGLYDAFADIDREPSICAGVLTGQGEHFCAGADLKAFMGMTGEFESSIPSPKNQILIGVLNPYSNKNKVLKNKKLQKAQKKSEELLETFDGRVLIRKSGTEHKIRIMVESNSQEATSEQSVLLTDLVESIS